MNGQYQQDHGYGRDAGYSNEQHARQPEADRQGNFVLYKPSHPDQGQNYVNARRLFQQNMSEPQPPLYPQQQYEQAQRNPQVRSMSSSNQPLSRAFGNSLLGPPQFVHHSIQPAGQSPLQGTAAFVRSYGAREPTHSYQAAQQPLLNFQLQAPPPQQASSFEQQYPQAYGSAAEQPKFSNPPPQSVPTFTRSLNSAYTPNSHFQEHRFAPPPQPHPQLNHGSSTNAQLGSHGGAEREYSPSPLHQSFRNNLVSPGPSSLLNSQFPAASQQQNLSSQAGNSFINSNPSGYNTQDYTNSLAGGAGYGQQPQISNSFSRISPAPQPMGYHVQDFTDPPNTYESRMMAVVKEKEKMKALGTHKQMMESLLDQKFKEFKTIINKNLKEKFDVELRRALFHLWKHYKNCNERPNLLNDFDRTIHESLKKVYVETDEVKEKNRQLGDQVRDKEIETTDVINRQIKEMSSGAQKDQQSRRSPHETNIDQRRFFLESQIKELNREIERTDEKIKELQLGRQHRIYEAKIQIEEDGRQRMNEIQRTLTLEFCPTEGNPALEKLRNEVASLRTDYLAIQHDWVEAGHGPNPHDNRIKLLEHEYFDLSRKYEAMKK